MATSRLASAADSDASKAIPILIVQISGRRQRGPAVHVQLASRSSRFACDGVCVARGES